jgi:hypothetical protein
MGATAMEDLDGSSLVAGIVATYIREISLSVGSPESPSNLIIPLAPSKGLS